MHCISVYFGVKSEKRPILYILQNVVYRLAHETWRLYGQI